MNLLLDTHTLIWYLEGDSALSLRCRELIEDPANELYVSIASFWEIAIKLSMPDKLIISRPFDDLAQLVWENKMTVLPIQFSHLSRLQTLPFHHKDPFDRLLIAQSMAEQMPILSRDSHFADYAIRCIW
jgi:PIN domain nuclease of toxin-antitoxin system